MHISRANGTELSISSGPDHDREGFESPKNQLHISKADGIIMEPKDAATSKQVSADSKKLVGRLQERVYTHKKM